MLRRDEKYSSGQKEASSKVEHLPVVAASLVLPMEELHGPREERVALVAQRVAAAEQQNAEENERADLYKA